MNKKLLSLLLIQAVSVLVMFSQYPGQNEKKMKANLAVPMKAFAFDLDEVKIKAGIFKTAMDKDAAYLLMLVPDRLLHRFHLNAGLPVKGEIYGGWESEGLSGHTLGHYLSACAMIYANTGNPEFKKRVDYITDELERCQQARKTGYVGAIPNEDSIFSQVARGQIRTGGFDLNGGWSPWYTVHKLMAGLVDAYLYGGNEKALSVVMRMADWTANVVNPLTETQRLEMLNCEYGGMNEVLANIYAVTGDRKYLELSRKFHDEFVMGQLAKHIDPMPGKHSNTNVPKAVGAARRYELASVDEDRTIASFFWETMVHHHSYVIGGNSNYEYCGAPDKLNDRLSDNTCETCNTYNMLKLTRHLFCIEPSQELADYYERALFNHILASQNPTDGMMCYFVPLRMGTHKQFSDQFNTFTCCVGSGMENHVKYAESIYYRADDGGLYVNLFIPSELSWKSKGIRVSQETNFPEGDKTTLLFSLKKASRFPLYIRNPKWARQGVRILVNDVPAKTAKNTSGFWVINRSWHDKDKVEIIFPMDVYTESMPDNHERVAFLYGPAVLAGQLGSEQPDPVYGTPVLLTNESNPKTWINPVPGEPLSFRTSEIGQPFDFILKPFFNTYDQYYSVYFDLFTPAAWEERKAEYEAEKERQQKIESRTIDNFRIGEMQPERDHHLEASEKSYVDEALGRMGREARAGHSFSFTMAVMPESVNHLLLTYIGDDTNRKFDIVVDGTTIATVEWNGGKTGRFYDVEYPIPADLIKNKTSITVKITANHGLTAGRIFGCRVVMQ
jgi:uncharacterized protein